MVARSLGGFVISLVGLVGLVIIFSASPNALSSTLAASHGATNTSSTIIAGSAENKAQPGPGTTIPPSGCPLTEQPTLVCDPCSAGAHAAQPSSCVPCRPVFTEAPAQTAGCPNPTPAPPPTAPANQPPQSAPPTIGFCGAPPTQPGLVLATDAVCGSGFHPGEGVTLTATGGRGTYSWSAQANSRGQLLSVLPAILCRLVPVTVVATGTSRDRSNGLTVSHGNCLSA